MQRICEEGAVLTCHVGECSFNSLEECRAPGIMIGGDHAMCDTFTTGRVSGMSPAEMSSVTRCDEADCNFHDGEGVCHAAGITVATHSKHADCDTFRPLGS